MLVEEKRFERIALVSRLLAFQQKQGLSAAEAMQNLRQNLPAEYKEAMSHIEMLTTGDKTQLSHYKSTASVFNRLAEIIHQNNGNLQQLFEALQISMRDAANQAKEYWSGFSSLIFYLVAVLVITMTIMSIFALKVMPSMKAVFDSMSAQLPMVTRVILVDEPVYIFCIVAFLVIVVSCILFSLDAKQKITQFLPFSDCYKYIPVVRNLKEVYGYFLLVNYLDVFLRAGLTDKIAFDQAKKMSSIDETQLRNGDLAQWALALRVATDIKTLSCEVDYQRNQINSYFAKVMIITREKLTLMTQITLGVLIGTLLMAMYLPIFQLGSLAGGE